MPCYLLKMSTINVKNLVEFFTKGWLVVECPKVASQTTPQICFTQAAVFRTLHEYFHISVVQF